MENFWNKLRRPILVQAPMEDVTDAAFRRLIARYGKPDVMFTEFTSADGLVLAPEKGQQALRKKLVFGEGERPIVAQLFTSVPDHMAQASLMCAKLGFDGIDINMGCPDRAVEKGGCGAALIKNPQNARALIRAAKESGLPVSVKTRLGYNTDELEEWLPELLTEKPAAITIHARTRKEMSLVPARWERVKRAVEMRDALKSETLILGNGDVKDVADARAKVAEAGCDGAMLGRAIYGNPWLYANRTESPTPPERRTALIEHLALFDELMSDTTNYATMKKHFKAYISGWDGAKDLRMSLMETESCEEATKILEQSK